MGVRRQASNEEIQKAFRNLARKLHPDRNPEHDTHAQFTLLNEAYQVLNNEIERAKYNIVFDDLFAESINPNFAKNHNGTINKNENAIFRARNHQGRNKKKGNEFLPLIPYVRGAAILSLLWVLFLGLDFFSAKSGPIEYIENMEISYGPINQAVIKIISKENSFILDLEKIELINASDMVQVVQTPMMGVVTTVMVWERSASSEYTLIRKFSPHYGIYNSFSFVLFLLLIVGIVGIVVKKRMASFLFSIGLFNIFFLLMSFYFLWHS